MAATAGQTSLRERKKRATRQALGAAAMRLAIERGLENVLVEDIAAAVDVSPRTFNNYFGSKYEAICALALDLVRPDRRRPARTARQREPLDRHPERGADGLRPGQHGPDPGRIRLVTCSPVLRGEYLKALAMMQYELGEEVLAHRTGAACEGTFFTRALARAVTAVVQAATERWLFTDPPVALAPIIEDALRELAGGMVAVLPPAGEARKIARHPGAAPG